MPGLPFTTEWQHTCVAVREAPVKGNTEFARLDADTDRDTPARAVFVDAGNMWPNGTTLRYCFFGGSELSGTPSQQNKVKLCVQEWEKYANIKFEHVASDSQSAIIRIVFDQHNGSWSHVGRKIEQVPSDQATMNLGWINNSEVVSGTERGVILHEFGHTLGLLHEHQSPARGGKLTLKEEPILEYYMKTQKWSENEVRTNILDIYNKEGISNHSKIDLKSIMMFFMPAGMNEEHLSVEPNNQLSELDKAYITINYPPDASGTCVEIDRALEVAGVDEGERGHILEDYQLHASASGCHKTAPHRENQKVGKGGLGIITTFGERASASLQSWIGGMTTPHSASLRSPSETDTAMSPSAQAIEDGFRSMQSSTGSFTDPRISYGRIPR